MKFFRKILQFSIIFFSLQVVTASNNFELYFSGSNKFYEVIPFEYVNRKIIIPVEVEGQVYRFILDTGAPTIISERLYEKIKTTNTTTRNVKDGTSKKAVLKDVLMPQMRIGDLSFTKIRSLVYDLHEKSLLRCFEVDGIIGSHTFGKAIIQINVPERKLIITNTRKNLNLKSKDMMKMQLRGNQMSPYVWVTLNDADAANERLLIDTGMGDDYDPSSKTFNALKAKSIFQLIGTSTGAASASLLGEAPSNKQGLIFVPSLKIMDYSFTNIVSITTASDHSRIGMEILEKGVMTFDFKKKRFYFSVEENTVNLENRTPRLSVTIRNDALVVGFIWDKNLRDKIKFGDRVVRLNDVPTSEANMCDILIGKTGFDRSEARQVQIESANGELITIDMYAPFVNSGH